MEDIASNFPTRIIMKEYILATHNAHKVTEINALIRDETFRFVTLSDIGWNEEIIEDGTTLQENARIKAQAIWDNRQNPSIGEDTGLEIEALNMEPGVYTARYAGPDKNADLNMDKVLKSLGDKENRKAQFRTAICLIEAGNIHHFEGIVRGHIALSKRGKGGFGYDPIFIPEGYDQTFSELSSNIKNTISHRARAVGKLIEFLRSL